MKNFSLFLTLACLLMINNQLCLTSVLAQNKSDNSNIKIDWQNRFQTISKQTQKNDPIAVCVAALNEANSFFGSNAGNAFALVKFQKDCSALFAAANEKAANDLVITGSPNASSATMSGRVLNYSGRPVPRARLTVMSPSGNIYYVSSNYYGYYRFASIPAGSVYIVSISDKRYQFASQIVSVGGDMDGIDFIAQP